MDEQHALLTTRERLRRWQEGLSASPLKLNPEFCHTLDYYFPNETAYRQTIEETAEQLASLEEAVAHNDTRLNLPTLAPYNGIGERIDKVNYHPSYLDAGDIIYGTGMLSLMSQPGGLLKSLMHFYITSHAGEAGHNCPVACSAGIIRVLNKLKDFKHRDAYLAKLLAPSYRGNFTGAQFITEIHGGSDVGQNSVMALKQENHLYHIKGEKWFCSNADAELIFMTARIDDKAYGTGGLGLFLVPKTLDNGQKNHYQIRQLKEKLGTRTMASGEIDFNGAVAYLMGDVETSFKLLMENVLHLSRIYNSYACLGLMTRAYQIAMLYAKQRMAFSHPIIEYPLVQELLATLRAERVAMMAFVTKTTALQDAFDVNHATVSPLLLRTLANLCKHATAVKAVEHTHRAIDVLGGNGAIETFSSLPRLLRDSIVCENWEGTHNTLLMQILRDIHKYQVDELFFKFLQDELNGLCDSKDKKALEEKLNALIDLTGTFKQKDKAIQSLEIKTIVANWSDMAQSVCLLQEAQAQQQAVQNNMKYRCYLYFLATHDSSQKRAKDQGYLSLIKHLALGE